VRGTGVLIRGLARMPIDFLMAALRAKELELSAGRSRRAWKVICSATIWMRMGSTRSVKRRPVAN
jgi:hypothetical protein